MCVDIDMYYKASFLVCFVDYDSLLDRYGVFIAKHFADSRIVNIGKSSYCLLHQRQSCQFFSNNFQSCDVSAISEIPLFIGVIAWTNAIYPTTHKK